MVLGQSNITIDETKDIQDYTMSVSKDAGVVEQSFLHLKDSTSSR